MRFEWKGRNYFLNGEPELISYFGGNELPKFVSVAGFSAEYQCWLICGN